MISLEGFRTSARKLSTYLLNYYKITAEVIANGVLRLKEDHHQDNTVSEIVTDSEVNFEEQYA